MGVVATMAVTMTTLCSRNGITAATLSKYYEVVISFSGCKMDKYLALDKFER